MNVADFDFDLPARFIAQTPSKKRDASRLMRLDRVTGAVTHHIFSDIVDILVPNDVLVLNNTRVIPARLHARKAGTGGRAEILLLRQLDDLRWNALIGGRNIRVGTILEFARSDVVCHVIRELERAQRVIEFSRPASELLSEFGEMPLPSYINVRLEDGERYQTVYSKIEGSAAAPTAGLHFTPELLFRLRDKGVKLATCTLHIGLDTFQPVSVDCVEDHKIHSEFAVLDQANAKIINYSKLAGGRIIAVGTTSARTLETAASVSAGDVMDENARECENSTPGPLSAFEGDTNLFIYPGYKWRAVDAMITNFHLPKSTLLMMLSAFAGRQSLLSAYETAKQMQYRFYSFGDAMFVH